MSKRVSKPKCRFNESKIAKKFEYHKKYSDGQQTTDLDNGSRPPKIRNLKMENVTPAPQKNSFNWQRVYETLQNTGRVMPC